MQTLHLDAALKLQSPQRDDIFRRAFKKVETFDFLDIMLQPSRFGLGNNRFTSHSKVEEIKECNEDEIADDSKAEPETKGDDELVTEVALEDDTSEDKENITETQ